MPVWDPVLSFAMRACESLESHPSPRLRLRPRTCAACLRWEPRGAAPAPRGDQGQVGAEPLIQGYCGAKGHGLLKWGEGCLEAYTIEDFSSWFMQKGLPLSWKPFALKVAPMF